MSRPAGKCEYCGKIGDLTKGHIWPEWIKKFLPTVAHSHVHTVGSTDPLDPSGGKGIVRRRVRQGHAGSRKLRNTCKSCNSGWMSRLENAAMPVAGPLIQNQGRLIQTFEQRILAAFLCLITLRVEFTNLSTQTTTSEDREWLMKNFEPPEHWKIWIANYVGKDPEVDWCRHFGMDLVFNPVHDGKPPKCNTQTTTIVIGHLCAHIFSSTALDVRGYEPLNFPPIWPPRNFDMDWGYVLHISPPDVLNLSEALAKSFQPVRRAQ